MDFISMLNAPTKTGRILAIGSLLEAERCGSAPAPETGNFVNNHIHTTFSFSPYSPASAVWHARAAGLRTAGIMDHDSVGGLAEFCEAAALCKMPVTCGFEHRVSFSGTPFAGRRLNNPDQNGVAYVSCHGIPRNRAAQAEAFLAPLRACREERDREMTLRLNRLLAPADVCLDFDKDVLSLSQSKNGGSVTERHLLFAVSKALVKRFSKGPAVPDFLGKAFGIECSGKTLERLRDPLNKFYEYDLLGVLKAYFVKDFYIPATDELSSPKNFVEFALSIGAIPVYSYLGDVGDSVTGDKKAAAFEDSYLEELLEQVKSMGFRAVTYMPSRNTPQQLRRIIGLCEKYNFLQISGEDINSPRQSFVCPALAAPEFSHLTDATWALIEHELEATDDPADSICGAGAASRDPEMSARVARYAAAARQRFDIK